MTESKNTKKKKYSQEYSSLSTIKAWNKSQNVTNKI